jgi:hypothetical protein
MTRFQFRHDGPVYLAVGDTFETAYYSRDKRKYKRTKRIGNDRWEHAHEETISDDHFWMMVACIERKPRHASH